MSSLAWGGYSNGRIPLGALTRVSNFAPLPGEPVGAGGALLMTEAARQWEIMCIDAFAATKERPTASECYRDLASQQGRYATYQKYRKPLAAYPGTSNHGWGRSVDIGTNSRTWITKNGSKYGFHATVAGEPWHFDYLGNPTITQSQALPGIKKLLENADMPVTVLDTSTGHAFALAPQWVQHLGREGDPQLFANITTINDEVQRLNGVQTEFIFQALGIPASYRDAKQLRKERPNGDWSKATEAADLARTAAANTTAVTAQLAALTAAVKDSKPGGVSVADLTAAIKAAGVNLQIDTSKLVTDVLNAASERLKS